MRLALLLIALAGLAAGQARAQPAAATLDTDHLPAAAPGNTLLHVTAAGRFAIIARSANGTAISLVDMITGPTPEAGAPGAADGRLDLLLDVGTYKLRTHPAAGAQGDVRLRVAPSRDAAPSATLPPDGALDATLADVQQRSFWFAVPAHRMVRIEAAGRALVDLRLWRDGRDLVAARAEETTLEPTHGHPLRDFRFAEMLPAGTYLVTAYGGPALPWSDGAPGLPFHIRAGVPDTLRAGWVAGQIGPFGSALYSTGGADDLVRLNMDGPATLLADDQDAEIDRRSRVQQAELRMASRPADHLVEVRGPEGAAYQLRSLHIGQTTTFARPGTYWLTANTTGFGGDDVPATLILARADSQEGFAVEASNAPEVGPGQAWRRRFNVAGPVSVLFHAVAGGKVAAAVTGLRTQMRLVALDSQSLVPPADPASPGLWDLPAGWFELLLAPQDNAAGVADVTIGPPGSKAAIGPPGPSAPSVSFGARTIERLQRLVLFGNQAPGTDFGLQAAATPVDMVDPLRISQESGQTLTIALHKRPGVLRALEIGRGPLNVTFNADISEASLPAPDHPRVVALFWQSAEPPARAVRPEPEAARPALRDGAPRFSDFEENDPRSFTLTVAKGGLYEVETLGRLRMRGTIGTHFIPELAVANANGVGQNMQLQTWLRAGQYHVDVRAEASAGHAGLLAAPAPLLASPALLPGGSVRAALPAGSGLRVPITIAASGSYRLDLLGLGHVFMARLEDADGWPLTASGRLDTLTQDFAPGNYRLLIMPEAVDASAVVRLARIEAPVALAGHGPHTLPIDAPQDFTWREPAGRADPRQPDDWRFALAAPADVTLSVTEGMEAILHGPDGKQAAHLVGGTPFAGRLATGDYRLDLTSQGRNDRLDYMLSLSATQLQPGVPRMVDLPATIPFAVATDRVVSLTTFGPVPVLAVLREAGGRLLGRYGARDAEWNVAISRLLPAGSYTLELASAAPPQSQPTPRNVNDAAASAPSNEADAGPDSPDAPETEQAVTPAQDAGAARSPPAQDGDRPAPAQTHVTLALPADSPAATLDAAGDATLGGGGVHRLALPPPHQGALILAGAAASSSVVLSLEQADGPLWRSRALAQGLAPLLAMPADGAPGAWRLSVWSVDGGTLPVRVAARVLDWPAIAGQPRLQPTQLPAIADALFVAHVALPDRAMRRLSGARDVLAGSWPGHAAAPPEAGLIIPQAADLWLVAPRPASLALAELPSGATLTMTVQPGATAALPLQAAPLAAWVADAQGQPGISSAHGMGIAAGSALGLAAHDAATAFNADATEALRISARPVALAFTKERPLQDQLTSEVPPASAVPLALPPGLHRLQADLAPGTALVAGWPAPDAAVIWAGHSAESRVIEGRWTHLLLVNTTGTAAPISLHSEALATPTRIQPDHALTRFFGAAGSLDVPMTGAAGQTLVVAGGSAVVVDRRGQVHRGAHVPIDGPGLVTLTLTHGAGPVAAWLDGPGTHPWPSPPPVAVQLPHTVALSGSAMRLALAPAAPSLLRVRTTAPVILELDDDGPMLFPAGASFSQYLPGGPHVVLAAAPQDGGLSGTMDLSASLIRPAKDGLGESVAVAPGESVLFGFVLKAPARIGLGVRAQPDGAALRLLDAQGRTVASGAAMLRDLPAGAYVLQASVQPDAPMTLIRPAVIGLTPRPNGPPAEIVASYRALAGLTASRDAAP